MQQRPNAMKDGNRNNFDFLRLLAASLVFISHQYVIAGKGDISLPFVESAGKLGVYIFFVISGYLTTESWRNDPHVIRFAIKRMLRIWPGLVMVTVFTALVIGPLVTSMDAKSYFSDAGLLRYFNILQLEIVHTLPGVFDNNPYPHSVNGSLWTIPIEVYWYACLGVLGMLGLTRFGGLFVVLNIIVVVLELNPQIVTKENVSFEMFYFIDFGRFFCYGICLSAGKKYWMAHRKMLLLLASSLAVIYHVIGLSGLAAWILVPYAVVLFGTRSTPIVRSFGKYGDFSYGLYLYAFPVQQTMMLVAGPSASHALVFCVSYLLALSLAYLSWKMIEHPALQLKLIWIRGFTVGKI